MKKLLQYFYNINVDELIPYNEVNYLFSYQNSTYLFSLYDRDVKEINDLYSLSQDLLKKDVFVHEFIFNIKNELLSVDPDTKNIYTLLKININIDKKLSLDELSYLSNIKIKPVLSLARTSWTKLWETRNDYLEYQINQMGKKFPVIVESFNYFIGLSENAISYVNNAYDELKKGDMDNYVLSHRHLNNKIESLYNPLNFIFDYKVRDLAEYIKLSFFNNNQNIYQELDNYFSKNYFSLFSFLLLLGRTLYPSFYFEMYEDTTINKKEEKSLLNLISVLPSYELYLRNIYLYLNKYYPLPEINWLLRKN